MRDPGEGNSVFRVSSEHAQALLGLNVEDEDVAIVATRENPGLIFIPPRAVQRRVIDLEEAF